MKTRNPPPTSGAVSMLNRILWFFPPVLTRLGAILILAGLLVSGFYVTSSASSSLDVSDGHNAAAISNESKPIGSDLLAGGDRIFSPSRTRANGSLSAFLPSLVATTVQTFASDCLTAKTVFNVSAPDKQVCAVVTGALPGWNIIWSDPNSNVVQNDLVTSSPQNSTFTLSAGSPLGDWRVIVFDPFGGTVQAVTTFTVLDSGNPQADLSVSKGPVTGQAASGSQVIFVVQVNNNGPNSATNVQLTDDVPANTSFVSFTQLSGPVFNCTNPVAGSMGTTTCTTAVLNKGDSAAFRGTYLVNTGTSTGTQISNTANVSSIATQSSPATPDPNLSNNSFTTTVNVAASPCVLTCPANITQNADAGQAGAVVNYTNPTSTGDCPIPAPDENGNTPPAITCSQDSGSFFPAGTTSVSCSGLSGNACTFQVTIVNPGTLSITLNGANPFPLGCGVDFNDPGATATDGTQSVPVTVAGTVNSHVNGSYTLTYTATEGANSVSTTRTVIVSDTAPPVITLSGANPLTVECHTAFTDPGASANDACVGLVPVTISGSVDANTLGTYTITYNAQDPTGNNATPVTRTVNVVDTTAPTITLSGANPMTVECHGTFTDPGATAHDSCAGDFAATASGSVDVNTAGTYIITYNAKDPSGNSATPVTRTVTVTDTTPPVISPLQPFTGSADGSCQAAVPNVVPSVQATDNCTATGSLIITQSPAAGTLVGLGATTITVTVKDSSGNSSTATTTFTVNDTTPPTVTAPANVSASTGSGGSSCSVVISDATLGTAQATDNCSGAVSITRTGVPPGNLFPVGTTTITYTAKDVAGNTATATQSVTVTDTTPPTLTVPAPSSASANSSCQAPIPNVVAGSSASDICGGAVTITQSPAAGTLVGLGTHTITVTATGGGGTTTKTTTFTVNDTTPPTIVLDNLTIFLNGLTIVINGQSVTINGQSYPLNNGTITIFGQTITINSQSVTINGQTFPLAGQTITLWPPNHKYHTVQVFDLVESASDNCDASVNLSKVVITKVTSDELENDPAGGDGNTLNDIVIAPDCKSVQLRAERNGRLNGRVYTIYFKVADNAGNVATATSKITVPKDQGHPQAIDDGPHYTVTSNCP